jgi:hypothetical protein
MALCTSACAPALPPAPSLGCGVATRNGGLSKLAFIKCDYTFDDVGDRDEWIAAIASGDVVLTGLILGQKAKGTFTKKRVSSCSPESIVGGEKSVTFQDYNGDPDDCTDITFYNQIQLNAPLYQFGYYTCDGYFYGPITSFTMEVDQVIEDNNTGSIYFDGTVSWNAVTMPCGVAVNLDGI